MIEPFSKTYAVKITAEIEGDPVVEPVSVTVPREAANPAEALVMAMPQAQLDLAHEIGLDERTIYRMMLAQVNEKMAAMLRTWEKAGAEREKARKEAGDGADND